MPDVSRAYFRFDVPAPPEPELLAYARSIFDDLDRAAERLLPFPDYDLYVAVEEGSVKGGGKVKVAAMNFVASVAIFGGFVQGVREISSLGTAVATHVIQAASNDPLTEGEPIRWSRKDSGTARRIERLFERVANHEIDPANAAEQTLALLETHDEQLPPEARRQIEEAFRSIRLNPRQLELPLQHDEQEPPPIPTPRERPLPPERRLLIEIRREGKSGRPEIDRKYR